MKLSKQLAKIFEKEMDKVIMLEKADPSFLPQELFCSTRERARAGVEYAMEKVIDTLALAIVYHREKDHGESREQEKAVLTARGADEQIAASSWWNS